MQDGLSLSHRIMLNPLWQLVGHRRVSHANLHVDIPVDAAVGPTGEEDAGDAAGPRENDLEPVLKKMTDDCV